MTTVEVYGLTVARTGGYMTATFSELPNRQTVTIPFRPTNLVPGDPLTIIVTIPPELPNRCLRQFEGQEVTLVGQSTKLSPLNNGE